MDLVQSCGNLGIIWGIGRRRASGEEVNSDLGPSISYIWGGEVVQEEIIEGLGRVVKLGSCLRSHVYEAGVDVERKRYWRNKLEKGEEFFFFFFEGNQRQVSLSSKNKRKRSLLIVGCTCNSYAYGKLNKIDK
jgi:hypothetical protein